MNGHISTERLALFARCDLPGDERNAISSHLQECTLCRAEAASFELTIEQLSQFEPEPLDEDLKLVRAFVIREFARRRSPFNLRWACLAGVAATLAIWVGINRQAPMGHPGRPAFHTLAVDLPAVATPVMPRITEDYRWKSRGKQTPPTAGVHNVQLIMQADGSSLLEMTTDDPNVVILLPLEEKGENHEN